MVESQLLCACITRSWRCVPPSMTGPPAAVWLRVKYNHVFDGLRREMLQASINLFYLRETDADQLLLGFFFHKL